MALRLKLRQPVIAVAFSALPTLQLRSMSTLFVTSIDLAKTGNMLTYLYENRTSTSLITTTLTVTPAVVYDSTTQQISEIC